MRKLLLPVAGLVALSLLLGACEVSVTPYAARVGGTSIPASALNDAMRTIAGNSGYRCEVVSSLSQGASLAIEGKGGSSYSSAYAADVLTQLVQYQALHADVTRLGLRESALAHQLATSQLPQAFNPTSGSTCVTSGAQVLGAFSPSYRSRLVQFEEDQLVLLAHAAGVELTRAGVAAYESHHAGASTLSCTSVIEVASQATAVADRQKIAAGASFASVARTDSLDSSASKGGSLGCVFPSYFTSPLNTIIANLPVGTVSPPVQFGTNYLLLLVTSRPLASLIQAAGALVASEQSKFSGLLAHATSSAKIAVDPTYGTWTRTGAAWHVTPRSGPPDALLPNPAAVTPPVATAASPAG
ncbi:MAG TPA: peptidylprolyl isomerase [Acidimicrobiales bacterium]|nr:peptidylprolyl isomerase [Acidimicrobiales bacterium]